jgi:uncharacterized membrane protein
MKINKDLILTIITWLIVGIVILIPDQNNVIIQSLRTIFWSIFILFLPGYWTTRSFFLDNEIDLLERFALSFALSISIVPLLLFYLNLVWLKITSLSVYLITLFIIIANLFYLTFLKDKKYVKNN